MNKMTKNLTKWAIIRKGNNPNGQRINLDEYIKQLRQEGYTIFDER